MKDSRKQVVASLSSDYEFLRELEVFKSAFDSIVKDASSVSINVLKKTIVFVLPCEASSIEDIVDSVFEGHYENAKWFHLAVWPTIHGSKYVYACFVFSDDAWSYCVANMFDEITSI